MADILDDIFSAEVLDRLQKQRSPSESLARRLAILTAAEDPDAALDERLRHRLRLAYRTGWVSHVGAMKAAGILDADVIARLTGVDDDNFRSALAECRTCDFLSTRLSLDVFGRHEGRPGTAIDLGVRKDGGDISVEVKSPFTEPPKGSVWSGDYAHVVRPPVDIANKQFADGRRNVLALVPFVDPPVLMGRADYVRAFLGETKVVLTIDTATGKAVTEPEWRFMPEGKLLKLWPEPRFTRTGAVLVLKEVLHEENLFEEAYLARIELRWFVIHNPHAPCRVPVEIWGDCPQLIRDEDEIRWTDGWSVDGTSPRRRE